MTSETAVFPAIPKLSCLRPQVSIPSTYVEPIQFDLYERVRSLDEVVLEVSGSWGFVREMTKILMVAAAKGSQAI